eukprot:jgi/Undpi1/7148/HiC_scaffold_22.g09622.m1
MIDFCEIVEQAKANSHQDQHRHQEDVTQEDEDNDDSTNQDQQAPSNPFANFAFGGGTVLVVAATPSGGKRKEFKGGAMRKNARARKSEADAVPQSAAAEKRTKAGKGEDFSKMTEEDLREVSTRWRDLADPKSGEEDKKFQVLVGAILSSRAQAAPVAEGLSRLRAREGGLTAATMADIEQDELAHILRSIHWNKAKAKHIREAGKMIMTRFRGAVPRRKGHLLALPGVGPVLGDILAHVFDFWKSGDAAEAITLQAPATAAATAPTSVVGAGGQPTSPGEAGAGEEATGAGAVATGAAAAAATEEATKSETKAAGAGAAPTTAIAPIAASTPPASTPPSPPALPPASRRQASPPPSPAQAPAEARLAAPPAPVGGGGGGGGGGEGGAGDDDDVVVLLNTP